MAAAVAEAVATLRHLQLPCLVAAVGVVPLGRTDFIRPPTSAALSLTLLGPLARLALLARVLVVAMVDRVETALSVAT